MTVARDTYIALLRAVNVGGTVLKMEALRRVAEGLGLGSVRTVLASGNLVFQTARTDTGKIESRLEQALSKFEGLTTDFFVRSGAEWKELIRRNPFPAEATADPGRLVVSVLKAPPTSSKWSELRSAIVGRERVEGIGRHAYIVYPDGQGRSKLSMALIERKLGTRGTNRNWNTVRRLEAAVDA